MYEKINVWFWFFSQNISFLRNTLISNKKKGLRDYNRIKYQIQNPTSHFREKDFQDISNPPSQVKIAAKFEDRKSNS